MLISLCLSAAFAAEVELPVRLKYDEYTGWGQDPVVVDDVLSAQVAVTNPTTGVQFTTRGSLFVMDRLGKGAGELDFAAEPAGTLHTWEISLLDAQGNVVGEPEVVDVLFGAGGDGTIVARASADIVVKNVKIRKRGVSARLATDGGFTVQVGVVGYGTQAAYVGIRELAADGAALGEHVDMEAMTAEVYASYQGLDLDAIVPLDTWSAELEGTLSVAGVGVGSGLVEEGAALDFDVQLFGPAVKAGSSLLESLSFPASQPLALKSKRATGGVYAGKRLVLRSEDQVFDSYDGAMDIVLTGDHRDLEVGAILLAGEGSPVALSDALLTLDPSGVALGGQEEIAAAWPGADKLPDGNDATVYFKDKDGSIMDDVQGMPGGFLGVKFARATADGDTGVVRYVGEALRNSEGRAVMRGLVLTLREDDTATLRAEVVGSEFEGVGSLAFEFDDPTLGVVTVPVAVTYTAFALDWTFDAALNDDAYALEMEIFGTTDVGLELEVMSAGDVAWTVGDFELVADPEARTLTIGAPISGKIVKDKVTAKSKGFG